MKTLKGAKNHRTYSNNGIILGSSVTATFAPSTYYLVVSGFDSSDFGTYNITTTSCSPPTVAAISGAQQLKLIQKLHMEKALHSPLRVAVEW